MASSDSQIDKPQRGRPKRAELPDININTGAQSIDTERSFKLAKKTTSPCHVIKILFLSQAVSVA